MNSVKTSHKYSEVDKDLDKRVRELVWKNSPSKQGKNAYLGREANKIDTYTPRRNSSGFFTTERLIHLEESQNSKQQS